MKYQEIQRALRAVGIDVRNPAAKQGVCDAPYVVVQEMGTYRYAQSHRLGYTLVSVHCYVPMARYDQLEMLTQRVREALAGLAPDLRPTGNAGVHSINDRFRAHETYVEYMIQRKV